MRTILPYLLSLLLLAGAVGHIVMPDFYAPLVPPFISVDFANISSTIVEAILGIALLVPKYRHWGGLGFALLMLGFLPLHIWDLFRADPMVGPYPAPIIRLLLQFLLIYAGWWVYQKWQPTD